MAGYIKKIKLLILIFCLTIPGIHAQSNIGISGTINWETMYLNVEITLDLVSAGIRLPAGRTQGESLLNAGYLGLIIPGILGLQADSSSTISDLIDRREFSLLEAEAIALGAKKTAPSLSSDMRSMFSSHSISLANISSAFLVRSRLYPVTRILNPVSAARYTGIVIIAADSLPVHGMRETARAVPCLFPKIWDSEMNLIYEKNMLHSRDTAMVRYSTMQNIFQNNPSGLSRDLQDVVGDRPLKIFASGVFGINPTDLIIDRSDALLILSSEENQRLLSQGRVVVILDESVLRHAF
ncbi:MAG: polymerase [Treponema sp.]|nr:polymerase [Treponema sp.]